jgi:hypothetical protein
MSEHVGERVLLLGQLKDCVHALIDANSESSVIISDNESVLQLLWLVERILSHGLKNVAFFGATTAWDYLQHIAECLPGTEDFLSQVSVSCFVLYCVVCIPLFFS